MSDLSNAKLKHAIDEYEGMVSSSSTIAALVTAAKELLAHRAARAADAERVRSVVRDAVHAAWPESKFGGNAPEAIAARAAEQLAGVRSDQREMDVACYAEVKRERDIALSECEKMRLQLAGAGVGLSEEDRDTLAWMRQRLEVYLDEGQTTKHALTNTERATKAIALLDRLLSSPPATWVCPAQSNECAIRQKCTNKCGRNDYQHLADLRTALCALLDSDMPAGDLRKAMAELVGRR